MTNEQKQLLLKDLCARLPYGVMVNVIRSNAIEVAININPFNEEIWLNNAGAYVDIDEIKPYLRPMSSMTEKEKNEYNQLCYNCQEQDSVDYNITKLDRTQLIYVIDWLNAHYFDFRNLIGRGLAIDCTNLNIY